MQVYTASFRKMTEIRSFDLGHLCLTQQPSLQMTNVHNAARRCWSVAQENLYVRRNHDDINLNTRSFEGGGRSLSALAHDQFSSLFFFSSLFLTKVSYLFT